MTKLCECGCGTSIPSLTNKGKPRRHAHGHWRRQSLAERFWKRVDKNGPISEIFGTRCWLWTGPKSGRKGQEYGTISYQRTHTGAHRISWFLHTGILSDPLNTVDHVCRNLICVNPDHLELVPVRVNILRGDGMGAMWARKTHCKKGHAYTEDNLVASSKRKGFRQCRTCHNQRTKERQALIRRERAQKAEIWFTS